jgi:ferredoxin
MRASIDREGCISCGVCMSMCPSVFYMGEDTKANLTTDVIQEEFRDVVREAAESCPVDVIHVTDD